MAARRTASSAPADAPMAMTGNSAIAIAYIAAAVAAVSLVWLAHRFCLGALVGSARLADLGAF